MSELRAEMRICMSTAARVERLFAEITRQQIRRGVFKSVAELEAAIETWLTERNAKPKPFKWTAKANIILEKNARARRALEENLAAGTNLTESESRGR